MSSLSYSQDNEDLLNGNSHHTKDSPSKFDWNDARSFTTIVEDKESANITGPTTPDKKRNLKGHASMASIVKKWSPPDKRRKRLDTFGDIDEENLFSKNYF